MEQQTTAATTATDQSTKNWASKGKRFGAYFIDAIIASVIMSIIGVIPAIGGILGPILAAAYILTRDGLPFLDFDSVGKKVLKLTVRKLDGSQTDMQDSIKRNIFLAIAFLPQILASFNIGSIGGILSFLGSILILVEGVKVLMGNQRFGDAQANTIVTEA